MYEVCMYVRTYVIDLSFRPVMGLAVVCAEGTRLSIQEEEEPAPYVGGVDVREGNSDNAPHRPSHENHEKLKQRQNDR